MYASQNFQVSSSLRQPKIHFRYAQGHQRASAILGSINITQNTDIPVYEEESQKKDYTKV